MLPVFNETEFRFIASALDAAQVAYMQCARLAGKAGDDTLRQTFQLQAVKARSFAERITLGVG